jgi:predicted enzyme related to lactoylglutathione lyase
MARVLGIGGVFFKSRDEPMLREWYARVLGLSFEGWGGVFFRPEVAAQHPGAGTVFTSFKDDTDYFAPSTKEFMIDLMVDDLDATPARCAQHGVVPVKLFNDEPNGRFAHIMDPEGRKLELWEPTPMRQE